MLDITRSIMELYYSEKLDKIADYYSMSTDDMVNKLCDMLEEAQIHKGCWIDLFQVMVKVQTLYNYDTIKERMLRRYEFLTEWAVRDRPYGLEPDQELAALQCKFPWTVNEKALNLAKAYCGMEVTKEDIPISENIVDILRAASIKMGEGRRTRCELSSS